MNLEQYVGCVILYNGRMAIVTGARSTYGGDFFYLRYLDSDDEFTVDAFDYDLMEALPDPEYGILKRRGEEILFLYGEAEYTLGSHPYEPCLYIKKAGETIRTLHNAFEVYGLPERFAQGETLMGIDGKEYDRESFCKALLAAIACDRPEMDFPFAAALSQTAESVGDYEMNETPKSLLGEMPDEQKPRVTNYCPNCGRKNDGRNYCTECGTRLLRD